MVGSVVGGFASGVEIVHKDGVNWLRFWQEIEAAPDFRIERISAREHTIFRDRGEGNASSFGKCAAPQATAKGCLVVVQDDQFTGKV